jgi:phospholipid/cholesterol/gamma-HCH transport system permease protein
MRRQATAIERDGRTAIVHLTGDIVVTTARSFYGLLRGLNKRRDVDKVVLDFSSVSKFDSSGVAAIELAKRSLKRAGKELELDKLDDRKRAAFELLPKDAAELPKEDPEPGYFERTGDRLLNLTDSLYELVRLVVETIRQTWLIITRRSRMPAGSVTAQALAMGANAVFIVGLLTFLLGMTIAFQGAVQLQRFGAGVFVSDMVGMSMVREFAPMMTAVMLSGRTGAAIAAELGTMRVGSEIDALKAMGVNPIRFLVVPRIVALTIVQPALTVMGMFFGIAGGMLVAALILDMSVMTFWMRMVERLTMGDFIQGIGKSFVFAWIIGFAGSHLGFRATGDATSVGTATTRTVVVSIFFIIMVDAAWATVSTLIGAK